MTPETTLTREERAILMYLLAPDRLLAKVRKEYADVLPKSLLTDKGREESERDCPDCDGYGWRRNGRSCKTCHATGVRPEDKGRVGKWDYSRKNLNGEPLCTECGEYGYHDWCAPTGGGR